MLEEGREEGTPLRRRVLNFLSRRPVIAGWYGGVLIYFVLLVLLPTLFVLTFVFTGFPDILSLLRIQPGVLGQIGGAVLLSYQVAIVVTLVDLVFGLPLAWFLVRRRVPGKSFVNTLIDLPLAVPTAGLGFSVALFWGVTPFLMAADKPFGALGLVSTGFVILILQGNGKDVAPVDQDLPGGGKPDAGDDLDEGGLAAAAGTENGQVLAGRDLQVDAVDGEDVPEPLRDLA